MTVSPGDYSSQHQGSIVAVFPGFPGTQTFQAMTAVDSSITVNDFWDGGFTRPGLKGSAVTHGEATLRRPWNRTRDLALLGFLRPRLESEFYFTVSKQPTTANLTAAGAAITYSVLLMRVTDPEVQQGNQGTMQELVIGVRVQNIV